MTEETTKTSESGTSGQGVQLGIGTLIIIAVIVSMCSGRGDMEKIQKDTAALKQQLGEMDKKLDALVTKDAATTSSGGETPAAPAQSP